MIIISMWIHFPFETIKRPKTTSDRERDRDRWRMTTTDTCDDPHNNTQWYTRINTQARVGGRGSMVVTRVRCGLIHILQLSCRLTSK